MLNQLPDLSSRQPFTFTATLPLVVTYLALAALAILPNTFAFKVSLLPFIIWQAWRCAIEMDFAEWLAQALGVQNSQVLNFWNFAFVMGMSGIALRSLEWTFIIKEPVRRYDLTKGQDPRVERDLCIPNVILDTLDLFFNQRGVGWSWSAKPFPRWDGPPPSIALIAAKLLLKLTVLDTAQYLVQLAVPAVGKPGGGSIFDPNLSFFPRMAVGAFAAICGGVWAWAILDSLHHTAALVGRVILRQPASVWPPNSHRPWLATSLREFWSFRWHQLLRHLFTVWGARPGGALFGEPGAVMGAFTISAIIHHIAFWGLGSGADFVGGGAFFLFMGIGAVLEGVLKKKTGIRVGGVYGWLWTMLWVLVWGMLMMDGWAKGGLLAGVYFPDRYRPGKTLVKTIVSLSAISLSTK